MAFMQVEQKTDAPPIVLMVQADRDTRAEGGRRVWPVLVVSLCSLTSLACPIEIPAPPDGDPPGSATTGGEAGASNSGATTGAQDSPTGGTTEMSTGTLTTGPTDLPAAPVLHLGFSQVKQFEFTWVPTQAEYYQLHERPELGEPYAQAGEDLSGASTATSLTVPLHFRSNASYILRACNAMGCTDSNAVDVKDSLATAVGYFKASNTGNGEMGTSLDGFGGSIALSADGNTLAVGAWSEDSLTDRGQDDIVNADSGAVYVFAFTNGLWSQQAYVKASTIDFSDNFGWSVALSGDGNVLAVGARGENSAATGINGDQSDNSLPGAGAAYAFRRTDGIWTQEAYIKASNTNWPSEFGFSLALSADGNTLAVSAPGEISNATGINGDQSNMTASNAGAVYVYTNTAGAWSQEAYIKASNTDMFDRFGHSIALGANGNTLAVGAPIERSTAKGVGGDQSDDATLDAGAVYTFQRSGMTWSQEAYIKASNTEEGDSFGANIALSSNGDTLAVGARFEDSKAMGIGGDQDDDSAADSGAVYVFQRTDTVWSQEAYVKASNTHANDSFGGYGWSNPSWGSTISLSADGNTLAVGAPYEGSSAVGVEGDQDDNSAELAGAVYVFRRTGVVWSQWAYVKAPNPDTGDLFGFSAVLSADGSILAVGAYSEGSIAQGVGGDQSDNSAYGAGAVYLY